MSGIVIVIIVAVILMVVFLLVRRNASGAEEAFIPNSGPAPTSDFRLTIEDTFWIKGRGLVATGKVESGTISVGQRVQIASADGSQQVESKINGLEAFRRQIPTAQTGDNIGLLLTNLSKDQVKRGMIIRGIE